MLLDEVSVGVDVVVELPEADVVSVVVVVGDEVPVMIPATAPVPVPVLDPERVDLYIFLINVITWELGAAL